MIDVADGLERAAALIEPAGAWIKEAEAQDANGEDVNPDDPDATRFCMVGALQRVLPDWLQYRAARALVMDIIGDTSLTDWNDRPRRAQYEVVAALREAAKLAREATDA